MAQLHDRDCRYVYPAQLILYAAVKAAEATTNQTSWTEIEGNIDSAVYRQNTSQECVTSYGKVSVPTNKIHTIFRMNRAGHTGIAPIP